MGDESILFEHSAHAVTRKSNLDLVNDCDSFPCQQTHPSSYATRTENYFHLLLASHESTYGLLLPSVVEIFRHLPDWEINDSSRTLTLIHGATRDERNAIIAKTTAAMRATGHFDILKGWRDELYSVYGESGEVVFDIERAASALFGIVTYGCHLTAYVLSEDNQIELEDAYRIWVPRRSPNKQTYGGMLDNTVAGGIAADETPFDCLVREAAEEASLPDELVRSKTRSVGTVTYFHIRDTKAGGESGLLQPECQYAYDLALPIDIIPKPNDDEVQDFRLMTAKEVKTAMASGEFKPNCACVLLDFFIRHGLITAGNERDYVEITSRLHRSLPFPMVKDFTC